MSGQSQEAFQNLQRVTPANMANFYKLTARDLHDVLAYLSGQRHLHRGTPFGDNPMVLDGCAVAAQGVPNMTVAVGKGIAFVQVSGSSDPVGSPAATSNDSQFRILNKRTATTATAAFTAPAVSTRYDLIELAIGSSPYQDPFNAAEIDVSASVDIFDIPLQQFLPSAVVTTQAHGEPLIVITTGAEGGTIPNKTAGRIPIAAIRLQTTTTSITQDDIFDLRMFAADFDSSSPGDASYIDVGSLDCTLPDGALTDASPQEFFCQAEARLRGVRTSFSTIDPMEIKYDASTATQQTLYDPTTIALIAGGSAPPWLYVWLVAQDDKLYRRSRANVTADLTTPSLFSHCGLLVFSHVAPSMVSGILTPASALNLPPLAGAGTCTGGIGKAVCIGALPYGGFFAVPAKRVIYGVRGSGGKARICRLESTSPFMPVVPTTPGGTSGITVEVGTGFQLVSSLRYQWVVTSKFLVGARYFDMRIDADFETGTNTQRLTEVFANANTDVNFGEPVLSINEVAPALSVVGDHRKFLMCSLPAAREPNNQATPNTGVAMFVTANYALISDSGSGLSASTAPSFNLLGWKWPNGRVNI
jgi:hypothetical protein